MALLFCDGFDHYTTMTDKWTTAGAWSIGAYGRFGTNGVRNGGSTDAYSPSFANSTVVIAGLAYMPVINSNDGNSRDVICFVDGVSTQVNFMLNTNYTIGAWRAGNTLLGSGTTVFRPGAGTTSRPRC